MFDAALEFVSGHGDDPATGQATGLDIHPAAQYLPLMAPTWVGLFQPGHHAGLNLDDAHRLPLGLAYNWLVYSDELCFLCCEYRHSSPAFI